jgi:HK97 gp10 family phage protein
MASNGFKLIGDKELERTFKTLGERVQRKLLRSAVSAAATPVVRSAKSKAKKRSGLLSKSLGKKIVTNKSKGSVTAIIGARKEVQGEYKGKPYKPSRISHLVEKGFINQHGEHIPPHPFLDPAATETQGQSLDIMQSKLASGIVAEAAKGAA